jgi:hypothetical protein
VTLAEVMLNELRRQHPEASHRTLWKSVYPAAIQGYDKLGKLEKRAAREDMRDRVRGRRHDRKRRTQ